MSNLTLLQTNAIIINAKSAIVVVTEGLFSYDTNLLHLDVCKPHGKHGFQRAHGFLPDRFNNVSNMLVNFT